MTALAVGIIALLASFSSAHMVALLFGLVAAASGIAAVRLVSKGAGAGRGMAVWGLILGVLAVLAGFGGTSERSASTASSSGATSASQGSGAATSPRQALTAPSLPAAQAPTASTIPGNGTFLVGAEVTPGTYRSNGAEQGLFEFCMWSRLKDTTNSSGSTIAFGTANANEPMIVTIAPGDGAFQSKNCEGWTRIK